jgi:diguanylate cyclase (GGDEF)-like protein
VHQWLVVAFLCGALTCLLTAVVAWRRRAEAPASAALAATMLAISLWCAALAVQQSPVPLGVQEVARWVSSVGIFGCATGLLLFARALTDPGRRVRGREIARLWVVPVLLLVALATNPWHHLYLSDSAQEVAGRPPLLRNAFGPFFVVQSVYCYALAAWSAGLLLRARRTASWYVRRQLTSVLLAAVPPIVVSALSIALNDSLGGTDYTPLGFVLTGLVDARAMFRQGLLRVVPVARDEIVEGIPDAIGVLDPTGRILDLNPAARALAARLQPGLGPDLVGRPATEVLPVDVLEALGATGSGPGQTVCLLPGLHVDARTSLLTDAAGRELGRIVVLRDISELVEQRERLQAAIAQLSEQLAVNEHLRAQLAEDAVRDPLTGVHNRRMLEPALALALQQARSVSVALFDVDHFKKVNDTHGHAAGDEVLKAVAGALVTGWRAGDAVIRYGGEEFVLVLVGAGAEDARRRVEEVRVRCAELAVAVDEAGTLVRVTVSAGVSSFPADGQEPGSLIAAADAALYAAKAGGRDRVVLAGAVPAL